MFTLVIFVLAALAIFFAIRSDSRSDTTDYSPSVTSLIFLGIPAVLLLVAGTVVSYTDQMSDYTELKAYHERIEIAVERADDLSVVLRTELEKYPEIEKDLIGNLDPAIILSFPNLKSNETITTLATELRALEDKQFSLQAERVEILRDMEWRNVSPWVIRGPWWNSYDIHIGS